MRTDTERLEWFADKDGLFVIRNEVDGSCYKIFDIGMGLCLAGKGATIQEAIDHAMTYQKGIWND